MVRELRRGTTAADIYSVSFSLRSDMLCCASDSGTVFREHRTELN
jgi:hypothetical protein